MNENTLFVSQIDTRTAGENQRRTAEQEIKTYPEEKLLHTPTDDLVDYWFKKHNINCLKLLKDEITTERVEIAHERFAGQKDPYVVFTVPFKGDAALFTMRASSYDFNPPSATLNHGKSVSVGFRLHNSTPEQAKKYFDEWLAKVETNIERQRADIEPHNAKLLEDLPKWIEARKAQIKQQIGFVESIGFPMSRREDAPALGVTRRKKLGPIPAEPPNAKPYKPQPSLSMDHYEDVLGTLQLAAETLERSPSAFVHMDEEAIRTQFLVLLNGTYSTPATGETFNANGKTDIFLRFDGGNVFVAECKFWTGEKGYLDIIDQLMKYVTWRDTKLAILVFNRNKGFKAVIDTAKNVAGKHGLFVSRDPWSCPNGFRCVYKHPDDSDRRITVTTLLFDVPT